LCTARRGHLARRDGDSHVSVQKRDRLQSHPPDPPPWPLAPGSEYAGNRRRFGTRHRRPRRRTRRGEARIPRPREAQSRHFHSRDDYAHCLPLFDDLATLPDGVPGRGPLRERLILEFVPLAERIATRFSGRGQPREDLVQVARIGLMKPVDRFEPGCGSEFLSFAVPTVMGEVRRFFRDSGWAVRVPRGLQDLRGWPARRGSVAGTD
jgi:hypothetical protein